MRLSHAENETVSFARHFVSLKYFRQISYFFDFSGFFRCFIKLFNFKKSEVNAIFNLIASDKLNIKFDINTLYNINNKFENEEIYSFFKDSIELISNLVLKLEE